MTLTEQLTYSLYIANCEKALQSATDDRTLEKASTCLDQPEFHAIPEHERCRLAELYSKRYFEISGAFG